jgi:hypothetical protein
MLRDESSEPFPHQVPIGVGLLTNYAVDGILVQTLLELRLRLQHIFIAESNGLINNPSSVPTLIEQSQLVGRNGLGHDDRLQRK